MVKETVIARGHPSVLGTHRMTIEITRDSHLTHKGDCIIGVNADKACADLSEELKRALKSNSKFKVIFRVGDLEDSVIGYGSPDLKLMSSHDIVIRKSSYIDDRTLLIKCDKSCADLRRELVNKLKSQNAKIEMIISY